MLMIRLCHYHYALLAQIEVNNKVQLSVTFMFHVAIWLLVLFKGIP